MSEYKKHSWIDDEGIECHTILMRDATGSVDDLNPVDIIYTEEELNDFINQLYAVGAFDNETRIALKDAHYEMYVEEVTA